MWLTKEQWDLTVALLAAAAWIPPIFSAVMKWRRRPVLTVDIGRYVEVGFTELGPVLNMSTAFTAEENILVNRIDIILKHESGSEFNFRWHELLEVRGMVATNSSTQPIYQEAEAIAMKILATDFKSVVLRNRLEAHTDRLHDLNTGWTEERRRLENSGAYNPDSFNASRVTYDISTCLLYTSPSPRDGLLSRMPSSA